MKTDDAVAHGIKSTAGVVTSAAAVMIAVFAIFATLSMLEFKQMGVGLATAILIDATLVRAVLLPATMKLLGELDLLHLERGAELLQDCGAHLHPVARSVAWKPITRWVLSQNGFVAERPQRQSATVSPAGSS